MYKKTALILGFLLLAGIAALFLVPYFFNVDRYRPQILEAANAQLNGKLDLGPLTLTLWGKILIKTEKLDLIGPNGKTVLSSNQVEMVVPVSSLIQGHPKCVMKITSPKVTVTKNSEGVLNLSLISKTPSSKADSAPGSPPTFSIPSYLKDASADLLIIEGNVSYQDEQTHSQAKLSALNVTLKDLSVLRPIQLNVTTQFDAQTQDGLTLKGPMTLSAQIVPGLKESKLYEIGSQFDLKLSEMDILYSSIFHKKPGIPLELVGKMSFSQELVKLDSLQAKLFNALIEANGSVGSPSSPTLDLTLKSNEIALKGWSELIPALKAYELGGSFNFQGNAKGPTTKLAYAGAAELKNLTAKSSFFKATPIIAGKIKFSTDQIEDFTFIAKAPGNDLSVSAKIQSFSQPKVEFRIAAQSLDLDQVIDWSAIPKSEPSTPPPAGTSLVKTPTPQSALQASDKLLEAAIDPIRKNSVIQAASGYVLVDIKKFQLKKILVQDILTKITLSNLDLALENFGMKAWGASLAAKGLLKMKPQVPQYQFEARVENLDIREASTTLQAATGAQAQALPPLKFKPILQASVKISTDRLEDLTVNLKAPGNDLNIKGKLIPLPTPKMDLRITSNHLDLNKLLGLPAIRKVEVPKPSPSGVPTLTTDNDVLLDPIRKNEFLRSLTANLGASMKFVRYYDMIFEDLAFQSNFQDMNFSLTQFKLKFWEGNFASTARLDLKPLKPAYNFMVKVVGLNMQQAVTSQLALFKDTITGKADFLVNGSGHSLNTDLAMASLEATGSMKVNKAKFASIDISKMVAESLNESLGKLAEKVPPLKGKKLDSVPNSNTKFDFISSDFKVSHGNFEAKNFIAKSEPQHGVDLQGSLSLDLKGKTLKTEWEVSDTYNLTHARDLSVEEAGVKIDHILAEGTRPVRFPVSVGCNLGAPCYSYGETPAFLAKIALANIANGVRNAAQARAQAEIKKKTDELRQAVSNQAPPAIKKVTDELSKKLFGH